jgi:hypothetical protein
MPRQAGNDRGGAAASLRLLHKAYHLTVGAQSASAGTDLAPGPGHRGATQTWVTGRRPEGVAMHVPVWVTSASWSGQLLCATVA